MYFFTNKGISKNEWLHSYTFSEIKDLLEKEKNKKAEDILLQFRIARAPLYDLIKEGQQDNQKFIEYFMNELDIDLDLQKKQNEEELRDLLMTHLGPPPTQQ